MTTTTDIRTLTGEVVDVRQVELSNKAKKIIFTVKPYQGAQYDQPLGAPEFKQPLYQEVIDCLWNPELDQWNRGVFVTTQSTKNPQGFIDLLSIAIAESGVFYDSQDKRNTSPPMQEPVTTVSTVDQDDISQVLDKALTTPEIKPYPFGSGPPVDTPKHLLPYIKEWDKDMRIAFAQGYNLALSELSYQDDPDVYIDRAWFHFQAITHITHIKQAPEINGDDSQGTVDTSDSDMVIKAEE